MERNKLISMVAFVEQQIKWNAENKKLEKDHAFSDSVTLDRIEAYAKFLSQPLELWMFVPCDAQGKPLTEPEQYIGALELAIGEDYDKAFEYQQAKERCIFEGFSVYKNSLLWPLPNQNKWLQLYGEKTFYDFMNIEYLTKFDVALTPQAVKQIYGNQ